MTHQTMLERVAAAIDGASQPPGLPDDTVLLENCARAAIQALSDPTDEMMAAAYEAMFDDKWDGTQAPMMGAAIKAAMEAALRGHGEEEEKR